ncbi:MAG: VC0807 family protein [Anaerolineae bacterium]|nr:hypothetical protein [Thermoflexales bacterium]MDW8395522.1 VC0807 family protein [Anaerolineae bacterium]
MKGYGKLILDIVIGAIVPILILNNLTRVVGAPAAYVWAALVPVAYILVDTFLISRRFNAITTYVALNAIMQGALAFWFVDGWRYALKDTAGLIVAVVLFFGSLALRQPMMKFFAIQAFQPDTPAKAQALGALFTEPPVWRSLNLGTALIGGQNLLLGIANFALNLSVVTASFGSDEFNYQVGQVNAITRIAFTVISFVFFAGAFFLVYRAIYSALPAEGGKDPTESDLWELLAKRGLLKP